MPYLIWYRTRDLIGCRSWEWIGHFRKSRQKILRLTSIFLLETSARKSMTSPWDKPSSTTLSAPMLESSGIIWQADQKDTALSPSGKNTAENTAPRNCNYCLIFLLVRSREYGHMMKVICLCPAFWKERSLTRPQHSGACFVFCTADLCDQINQIACVCRTKEAADDAIRTFHGQYIGHRKVKCSWAQHKQDPSANDYVTVDNSDPSNSNGNQAPTHLRFCLPLWSL